MKNYSLEDAFKALEDIDEGVYTKTEVKSLRMPKNNVKLHESKDKKLGMAGLGDRVKASKSLKESKVNSEELAKFIENSVKSLKDDVDGSCYYYNLDDEYSVVIKYEEGFGEEVRNDLIQSATEPDYAICSGIFVRDSDYFVDAWNMPYFEDGEVFDTDGNIPSNFDALEEAKNLIDIYEDLKNNYTLVSDDGLIEPKDKKSEDELEEMYEPLESFKTFKFKDKTEQGYDIVKIYRDYDDNRVHVIVKRPKTNDFAVGIGYSLDSGVWNQGRYDFKTVEDAEKSLKRDYHIAEMDMRHYLNHTFVKDRIRKHKESEGELSEAKSHDEYTETGFGTTKDGKEIYASGSTDQTRTYWREHVKLEIEGLGTGYGNYKWMNRPWQRWDYASALEDAMADLGIDNKLAKECIENSHDLRGAIKYLASKLDTSNKVEEGKTYTKKTSSTNKELKETFDGLKVYPNDEKKACAFENAIDCLYYGYGKNSWNSCGLSDEDAKEVWHRAFEEITKDEKLNKRRKLKESPVTNLEPRYDSRKSFYKKAKVDERDDGSKVLYSYGTPVVGIRDGKATLLNRGYYGWSTSQTTLRHVKDFLQQEGFEAGSIREIAKMYPTMQYDTWNSNKVEEGKKKPIRTKSRRLKEDKVINLGEEDEAKEGKEFLKQSEDDKIEKVVDVDANTVEKLKDSYIGNVILQCPICKTLIYKQPEELEKDGDDSISLDDALYNVDETCPHCGGKDGFKLVGQVSSLDNPDEASNEELPEPNDFEDEPERRPEEIVDDEESQDENEFAEGLVISDLNEEKFDKLVNKYLHEVYENVDSYKTKIGSIDGKNNIFVEGIIKFKDGKQANTKFRLEAKELTKGGKYKFTALNETFSKSKKAFTFISTIKDNKLMCESLSFKYNTKVLNENKLVRGKVSLKNKKK